MERLGFQVGTRGIPFVIAVVVGAVAAGGVFYLTPLKNVSIIEPRIIDIAPRDFYDDFTANEDRYIFIDVRPADVYRREHADGSINIPLHQLYTERTYLPRSGKTIVLICSGGSASGVAYSYLEHYGFLNLRRIAGGIEAWRDAGLPLVAE